MTDNQNPQPTNEELKTPEITEMSPSEQSENAPEEQPKKKKSPALKIAIFSAIAVAIILLGVFVIFPDHIDYMIAEHKFNSGDFENARLDYWDLGDFKDSQQKVLLCHEGIGDKLLEEGEYEDAVTSYSMAENDEKRDEAYYRWAEYFIEYGSYKNAIDKLNKITTKDVSSELTEAEYLYFSAEKDNDDILQLEENFTRFKALADSGYKDSKTIFDEAYAWDIKVYLSNKENDFSFESQYKINFNDTDKVSRKDKMYFTVCLEGGMPDEELEVYYKISFPDTPSKKESFSLCVGEYICPYFWYTSPSNAPTGSGTFRIYNAKTDKVLFTKKFTVTK